MSFLPERRRAVLAWAGLFLMAICLYWWQSEPATQRPAAIGKKGAPEKPSVGLVIIDAGHGGQDSGAVHNGVLEKDLTLDVARRVEGFARVHGLRAMLTR